MGALITSIDMSYSTLEKCVLDTFVSGEGSTAEVMRTQLEKSRVVSRQFTGAGFFVEISVDASCAPLKNKSSFVLDNVICEINNPENFVGFLLYITDGFISTLEGYTFGDVAWPHVIKKFICKKMTEGQRKASTP